MLNRNDIIFLATDHAGFNIKENVKKYLLSNISPKIGVEIIDYGASIYNPDDNYPDYIHKAGKSLSLLSNPEKGYAFVFGKSGTGEGIIMNRYDNVRCLTLASNNLDLVRLGREHNNINSISFGADFVTIDIIIEAINLFFNTNFQGGRHIDRVRSIEK